MIRVIKIGGRAQADSSLAKKIAGMWKANPGGLIVVHGGGDEISSLQQRLGVAPEFVAGRRVTTSDDIDLVRMALSGLANKRLVADLINVGANAIGISGEDGGLIIADPMDAQLGRVGKPVSVEASLLRVLLGAGYLPVVSPVARGNDRTGALNVNGDDAAAAIAATMDADELLLIADVEGVFGVDGVLLDSIEKADATELASSGIVTSGMLAKLEAGFNALAEGVRKVRIGGIEAIGDQEAGTTLSLTPSLT